MPEYKLEAALLYDAPNPRAAILLAEGDVRDPARPCYYWRVTNMETGHSELIDGDDIDPDEYPDV